MILHLRAGDAEVVVAGGQESMSLAPHVAELRKGKKMGPITMVDSMVHDGLTCAFNKYHMGTRMIFRSFPHEV
jgi:acetyl-CoA C-acetyltransferase